MRKCDTFRKREGSWFIVRIGLQVIRCAGSEETIKINDYKDAKRCYNNNRTGVLFKDID